FALKRRARQLLERVGPKSIHQHAEHRIERIRAETVRLGIVGLPFLDEFAEPLPRSQGLLLPRRAVRAIVDCRLETIQHDLGSRTRTWIDFLPAPLSEALLDPFVARVPRTIAVRRLSVRVRAPAIVMLVKALNVAGSLLGHTIPPGYSIPIARR